VATPVYVLDVQTGTVNTVPDSEIHEGTRPALVWSPDGTAISVASLGHRCGRIVAVATGETRLALSAPDGGCYAAYGMAWAPDGRWIASLGVDGTIRVWRMWNADGR
jgi:WD40 repeat protein